MRHSRFLSNVVTAPASYALVDLTTVKTYLGVSGTQLDASLTLWVAAASAAAQKFCANPFVVETRRDQFWKTRDTSNYEAFDRPQTFQLRRYPIVNPPSPALTNPPAAPACAFTPGGALPQRLYFVRLSFTTANGETAAGPEARVVVPANMLLSLAPPAADAYNLAQSWSVYAGGTAGAETLQASGLGLTSSWTEPTGGLASGASMPAYALITEALAGPNATLYAAVPLAEAVDFVIDPETGQLARLDPRGDPMSWRGVYASALYQAGYATIPADVVEAVAEMVKQRYYAQTRDPMARSVDISGVISTSYWFASGPGSDTDMPPHIQAKLERYRLPTFA